MLILIVNKHCLGTDPDAIEEEMKGFIINNDEVEEEDDDEEEGGESGEEDGEGKRKRDDDDEMDDRLEDDDFDLIEENLGIKVNRKVSHVLLKKIWVSRSTER